MTDYFLQAFDTTMKFEGWKSNHHLDRGGQTYRGISRANWPGWEGWQIIDAGGEPSDILVQLFYRVNFWDRVQGDKLAGYSPAVASEVFDTAVNCGVGQAGKFLQRALNLLNQNQRFYPDLPVSGTIGPQTLDALSRYFSARPWWKPDESERRLLALLNVLQGAYYVAIMERNPTQEIFTGWWDRVLPV